MKTIKALMATTAVTGLVGISLPALAQTSPVQPIAQQCADDPTLDGCDIAQDEGDPIVVTGSRIRLPNLESLEPIVTVNSQYLESRNLTNVADALNEIPGFRGSVTPNGSQPGFGQGVNFINTFGLGSNRTLTLLNGRRVVSSNVPTISGVSSAGTQVDLNIIPAILIDRIDRVAIGGAPVYGSDAIAGTVNIILKDRFTGLELRGTSGITEEGDNFRFNVSGAYGMDFAGGRGNITLAASYEEVDGVLYSDRDFLRGVGGTLNPSSALAAQLGPPGRSPLNDGRVNPNIGFNDSLNDGFPDSILVYDYGIPTVSINGVIANIGALRPLDFNYQFARDGRLVPFNRGVLFGGPVTSGSSRSSGGDGFDFSDFLQVTSDVRRISGNLFANYDLTQNIRLFAEGMYYNGRGDELIQQQSFNATLFGSGSQQALVFSVDNPLLSDQARDLLVANGYETFRVSRTNLDLSDVSGYSENDLYRGVLGVSGDFEAFGKRFNFEVSGTYGRNDFRDFREDVNQQNFVNAVNVTRNAAGDIICDPNPAVNATPGFTPIADPACVPLSLFGFRAATEAARDYVVEDVTARSRLEQWVFNANIGGSPFDLFGNPVAFNVGYEHRNEKARFTPDAFQQAGLGRQSAVAPTAGEYNLDEVFGEVLIPLLTPNNEFIFDSLQVFGRGRYVDNTVNGGFFAWSAGGSFAPIRDIEFRGNFTKSFRAPAVVELFTPIVPRLAMVPDICSPSNRNAGPVPEIRSRNCAAFLAAFPNSTPLGAATLSVPSLSGGNPNLDNEEADSFTFGVILRPRFVPGLSIAVDYLDIEIKKPITSLSVNAITQGCFDNPDFDASNPANGNAFCSLIRRDANGQVPADLQNPAVRSGFVNGVGERFKGVQGTLDYITGLDGLSLPGSLGLGAELFYVHRRVIDTTGIAPARSDGVLGDPKWQGQFRIRYFTDDVTFATNVNYVGEQLISRFNRGPSPNDIREFDKFDDFITIDSSISTEIDERLTMTFSVTNLTNRVGQEYFGVIVPDSLNDRLGRRFAVSGRMRF